MPRGSFPLDLLALDRGAAIPLNRQLSASLRSHILDGRLLPRTRVPATRELAADLGVSRNTVMAAYDALLAEGYLESVRGSGTRVAALPAPRWTSRTASSEGRLPKLSRRGASMVAQPVDSMTAGRIGFHPGLPETALFPFPAWAKLMASELRDARENAVGYHQVAGHPGLRAALVEYLAVSRGVRCNAEQVIVLTGAQAALDLIARLFMDPGDVFQIEDPGYLGAYSAFANAGAVPKPFPVGPDGWQVLAGGPRPRIIFTTPSCQWPLGLVMPLDMRLRLLQLAEAQDAWIVEDDYDSEYRFRSRPVPAMQGLDESGRVIYLGTMSKTMFPSLRVAYIVVPETLVDGFTRALAATGQYPPLFLQAALGKFISEGLFAAHLRRMRRIYAERAREFVDACRNRLAPWLTVNDVETGMQVVALLRQPLNDGEVLEAAVRRGVDFSRLSTQYRHSEPRHGLILGYAGVGREKAQIGIERLRSALEEVDRRAWFKGKMPA